MKSLSRQSFKRHCRSFFVFKLLEGTGAYFGVTTLSVTRMIYHSLSCPFKIVRYAGEQPIRGACDTDGRRGKTWFLRLGETGRYRVGRLWPDPRGDQGDEKKQSDTHIKFAGSLEPLVASSISLRCRDRSVGVQWVLKKCSDYECVDFQRPTVKQQVLGGLLIKSCHAKPLSPYHPCKKCLREPSMAKWVFRKVEQDSIAS